jgi:hypothetical protein
MAACCIGKAGASTKVEVCWFGEVVMVVKTVECWLGEDIAVKLAVVVRSVGVVVMTLEVELRENSKLSDE